MPENTSRLSSSTWTSWDPRGACEGQTAANGKGTNPPPNSCKPAAGGTGRPGQRWDRGHGPDTAAIYNLPFLGTQDDLLLVINHTFKHSLIKMRNVK